MCQEDWGLIAKLYWGIYFQAHVVAGRVQFLAGCWAEGFTSLTIIGSLLHGPPHYDFVFHQSQKVREAVSKTEVTNLCYVTMEVTSHHLCCYHGLETSQASSTLKRKG